MSAPGVIAERSVRTRTHYLTAGDGPALVLLHGGEHGACAELTWEEVVGDLARTHRVIAPDYLGYGYSDKLRDFTGQRRRFIEQIAELLDELGVRSATFVGVSVSARMLLDQAATAQPDWPMDAIVAVGVGLDPPAEPGRSLLANYDGTLAGLRPILRTIFADPRWSESEDYLQRRYDYCMIPGAWECAKADLIPRPNIGGRSRGGSRQRATDRYRSITLPTCLIRGEHDQFVPEATWQALVDQIPHARSHVIAGAGHYPQIERAAEFLSVLRPFLAGLQS